MRNSILNQASRMEADTISKNAASLKSLMSKGKFMLLSALFTIIFAANTTAQSEVSVGLSIPQGDASKTLLTGFNLGYKYLSPLSFNDIQDLYWIFSANLLYNNNDEDLFEYDIYDDITVPKVYTIPVMIGAQYEKTISPSLGLWGEAGLGLRMLKMTDLEKKASIAGASAIESTSYDTSFGFAYKIGAGLVYKDKYTVSLGYVGLGSPKVKFKEIFTVEGTGSYELLRPEKTIGREKIDLSYLTLSLGMRF